MSDIYKETKKAVAETSRPAVVPGKEKSASKEDIYAAIKLLLKEGYYISHEKNGSYFSAEMIGKSHLTVGGGDFDYGGKPSDKKIKKALKEHFKG